MSSDHNRPSETQAVLAGDDQADYDRGRSPGGTREPARDLPPRNSGGDDPDAGSRGPGGHVSRTSEGVGSPTGDDVSGPGGSDDRDR